MNFIELTTKTGSAVLKSQLTKTIVATAAGFIASKMTGELYEKVVIGQPTEIA